MADEKPGDTPEPVAEIDIEAVDDLSPEDSGKLLRGEVEPPRKGPKPAEKADGPKDEFDVDPKSETVPHGQFHRVNERRKAAEAERQAERTRAEQAEARANTAMQRMAELLEASKPPAPEPDPGPEHPGDEPDAMDNPYEYGIWRQKTDKYNRHHQAVQQAQQQAAQRQQLAFTEAVQGDVKAFKTQAAPDYDQARDFYWNNRGSELMALGYSREQAIQLIHQDEAQIANIAVQRGQSPAATLYSIARARGYAQAQQAGDQPATNGATPPKDPVTGKFVAASAAMDKREATRLAAKSLGGSGGPSDGGELTPQMLVDMSNDEYAAWKKANGGENALRKFFGARQ